MKKDCTTCKYGYEDEQLGIPMCHHPKRFSEDCVDFNMHEEKHLDDKSDKSLEEEAEEYYDEMWDELGGFAETRDGCYDIFFPSKAIRNTFIAGAEWQKSQMLKDAEECELYWDGDFLAIDLNMVALGYSEKDKVKVIVLKAEEE